MGGTTKQLRPRGQVSRNLKCGQKSLGQAMTKAACFIVNLQMTPPKLHLTLDPRQHPRRLNYSPVPLLLFMMARIKGTSRASHENETSCVPENDYPPIRRSRTRMMAEASVIRGSTPTSSIPQKRALGFDEEPHAPAVSSPLNPDFGIAKTRKPPPAREQREKKESLKKREAKGVDIARAGTPDSQSHGRKSKKGPDTTATPISLNRYFIPKPKEHDFDPPTAPILVQSVVIKDKQFYSTTEQFVTSILRT